jgi:hypothetical protein
MKRSPFCVSSEDSGFADEASAEYYGGDDGPRLVYRSKESARGFPLTRAARKRQEFCRFAPRPRTIVAILRVEITLVSRKFNTSRILTSEQTKTETQI